MSSWPIVCTGETYFLMNLIKSGYRFIFKPFSVMKNSCTERFASIGIKMQYCRIVLGVHSQ